jgi:ankyrin repeat protein
MGRWEALLEIIKADNVPQLHLKILSDCNLLLVADEEGWSLLMLSVVNDAYECFMYLIHAGADINKKNNLGLTPLMFAVIQRNFEITRALLQQGVEVSSRTKNYKESAFDLVLNKGRIDEDWFNLFVLYKEQFDEKDVSRYYEYRLSTLFS